MKLDKVLIFTNVNLPGLKILSTEEKSRILGKHLTQMKLLGLNARVVLGPDGDALMRTCPALAEVDIAFSMYEDLFSSIADCIEILHAPHFIVPLQFEALSRKHFKCLSEAYMQTPDHEMPHLLRLQNNKSILYPYLLNLKGIYHLQEYGMDKEIWHAHDFNWKSIYYGEGDDTPDLQL